MMEKSINTTSVSGLLDQGCQFEGKLSFEGVVHIGGQFKGEIFTRDTLVIQSTANVEAIVEADEVIISGQFSGQVFARRRVLIHPPAVFRGSITSPSLKIDEGVSFEGATYMPRA